MTRVHIRQGDLAAFDAGAGSRLADVTFVLFDPMAGAIFGKTWDRISGPEG